MLTKTKIVLITALVVGSASVALADGEFDPNLGNRYPAYNGPVATQRAAAQTQRGFVQAPARLGGGVRAPFTAGTQNSGYHANADLRYGPQPDYPQSPAGGGY
jgi:hypothetical protein